MESKRNTNFSARESFDDQHFLVDFILSTYLGPDVYSDNPRRSAFQRLAEGLPPYTSKNLGVSFLSIAQLQSLYYYILRDAHPGVVLKPDMFYMYLKGNFRFPSSKCSDDHNQFTSFFPLNRHDHKRYSESYEIVKGIVLIEDPVTSHMKKEDLERFKYLTGIKDLKIDTKKCLSYQPANRRSGGETEPKRVASNEEEIAGAIHHRKERSSELFREKYKRRRCCNTQQVPGAPCGVSMLKHHNEESSSFRTCEIDGPFGKPVVPLPRLKDVISGKSITLNGTAREGIAGPPIGILDIGISKAAYFFQVALPGVRRDFCQFSCEIESDGRVHIQGSTAGGKTIKKRSRVFQMSSQQLCPAGPFTLSFNLPGAVDPRMFSPNFRNDGIFEAVVLKHG